METNLFRLFEDIKIKQANIDLKNVSVNAIEHNSKNIKSGNLFVCLTGEKTDGANFISEAINLGAVAVVCEKEPQEKNIPFVVVENCRKAFSHLSKNFFNKACDKLKIISVVGTNGKTSCTYFIKSILETAGFNVGLIGTHSIMFNNQEFENDLTTPDPFLMHKTFYEMQKENVEFVVMEVSAHAIKLEKMEGVVSEVGLFTNCTQDHLDFFKTMENYSETKASFFCKKYMKKCVVNTDDELGVKIARTTNIEKCVSYGIENPANCFAIEIDEKIKSSKFLANIFDDLLEIEINFGGEYNVFNALGSASVCKILGVSDFNIINGLKKLKYIPGRNDFIENNLGFHIVIDYAHTPDGLEKCLSYVRGQVEGKIFCVFGATGNRDKIKRPIMGEILNKFCDVIVLTSDSPDNEEPLEIINQVNKGIKNNEKVNIFIQREDAVKFALKNAKQKDAVLILGKGTEDYQVINGKKVHYSDYEVVNDFLNKEKK